MSIKNDNNLEFPFWLEEEKRVIEPLFCEYFLALHPMLCIHGKFYTVDGVVTDESQLKKEIYDLISPWIGTKVARKVEELINSLRMRAYEEELPLHYDRIHVANGTCFLDGTFSETKEYCRNRIEVDYNPGAPEPVRWKNFLSNLLHEEDIPTLQEYLGYCLLPTTKAQKMLMMIGKGGEGKSRIGLVMRAIMGNSMNTTSIQKIETNRFSRADLENKLLMVDDDMDMGALPKTNYIKSIVTAECKMDVERKGIQSYQSLLYVRFLCFGNGALTALHDRSDGFYRRQIVLMTKDKPADRVDDPFLVERMLEEKEGIFLWCLEGLKRLILNNYRFSISDRARSNVESAVKDANNIIDFLKSEGYITFGPEEESSTKALYEAYKEWCTDNAETPLGMRSFSYYLKTQGESYGIRDAGNNIYISKKKRCRGYKGVSVVDPTLIPPF